MTDTARLEVRELAKTFGANRALRGVSLEVAPGEIHGLVGENGSGKSTLVKLLSGYHAPDHGGQVLLDGEPLSLPVRPANLRRRGMSVVHQDLGLLDSFSVVENMRMGTFGTHRLTRAIRWRSERERAREALAALGQDLDVDRPVRGLAAAERATIAIARALQHHEPGKGLIMFDESSRALPRDALAHFHALVRGVADRGGSVLYVSHRLEEVLALAHCVSVIRDGEMVAAGVPSSELKERSLIRLMLGYELERPPAEQWPRGWREGAAVAVSGLRGALVEQFDLVLGPGEIVGVTGLLGSGFEEIPYLLGGARRAVAGRLTAGDVELSLTNPSPRRFTDAGVALVPERRGEEGLALELSVLENVTIPRVRTRGARAHLGRRWQHDEADWVIRELGVRPAEPSLPVGALSGGNQQKVLLGKWLVGEPRLLLLHEPTQGVDVGAHRDILGLTFRAAQAGCAVLVAGLDASELAAMCDRVLIMRGGRVEAELRRPELDFEAIVTAVYGVQEAAANA